MPTQEQYWRRFARTYDRDGIYVVGQPIMQAITDRLAQERDLGTLLEFGCGTGYLTRVVAEHATRVVATDLSDEMLSVARAGLGDLAHVTVEKADCTGTSYPAGRFDSLFMANLIHVIPDPAGCLRESYRVLKAGGTLIIVDLTLYGMRGLDKFMLILRYLRRWGRPPREGRGALSGDALARLATGAGFKIQTVELLQAGSNALYLRAQKME